MVSGLYVLAVLAAALDEVAIALSGTVIGIFHLVSLRIGKPRLLPSAGVL